MFRKSSLGSRKSFPGGRRDAGAFQELRQLTAEPEQPHAVEKEVAEAIEAGQSYQAPPQQTSCTCPPEPEHDHDVAAAEGEGMPPLKNNCKACYPPSTKKILVLG